MTTMSLVARRRKVRSDWFARQFTRPTVYTRPLYPAPVTPARPFAEGLEEAGPCTPIDQRPLPTIDGRGLTHDELDRVCGARNRARFEYARSCPEATEAEVERVARLAATDELRRTLKDRPAAPPLPVAQAEPQAEAAGINHNNVMVDSPAPQAERKMHLWKAARVLVVRRGDGRFEVWQAGRPLADFACPGEAEAFGERVAKGVHSVKTPEAPKAVGIADTPARSRRMPFTADDLAWWSANSPSCGYGYHVLPGEPAGHDDFPPRKPGVERGPMPRKPSNGLTGYTDADVRALVGSVG